MPKIKPQKFELHNTAKRKNFIEAVYELQNSKNKKR